MLAALTPTEGQPETDADPIKALKLKVDYFRKHLLLGQNYSHQSLPRLVWDKRDLDEIRTLVHAAYMISHKKAGTTQGKELRWVDSKRKRLRLIMTIEQMIKSIPLRPFGIVERELLKLNRAYNPTLLILKLDKEAISQHNALKKTNPRYKALLSLNAALGEPKASITQVQVKDFDVVLRELCRETKAHIERGWEKLRGDRVQKLMDQILFLDLQRQEIVWRLAYWDQVEAIAGWIVGLHDKALTDRLSDVAVYVPETPEEFLRRRKLKGTLKRVNDHRDKHKGATGKPE
jgi:hypothetical protein